MESSKGMFIINFGVVGEHMRRKERGDAKAHLKRGHEVCGGFDEGKVRASLESDTQPGKFDAKTKFFQFHIS